ncbi:Zinc finger protein [Fasciola gigantica]|uniref:Zinc finger protein n=1 Tax=Fasciola gigantica TaxID=46835 RepID=A0A504Z1W8_FASGI|nr:Zinc finger protein [Fasciola gigantica]
MQLNVDSDVYQRFHTLKRKHNHTELKNSQFLSQIINSVESHGLDDSSSHADTRDQRTSAGHVHEKVCPECKFITSSSEELCDHFETSHAEKGSFSCTCGDSYARLPDFPRHYIDWPIATTDLQDTRNESVIKRKTKRRHIEYESTNGISTDDVVENGDNSSHETFYSYRHPSVSPIAGPSEEKPYGCPKCSKGFKSKSLLDQHMHLHYPPRYKCRWCGNIYRWPPVYYHHKQKCKKRPLHSNSDADPSRECNGTSESPFKIEDSVSNEQVILAQKTLAQFMNIHGMSLPNTSSSGVMQPPLLNGTVPPCKFQCICSEVFPTLPSYLEHTKSCSSIIASTVLENISPQALLPNLNLGLDFSSQPFVLKSDEDGPMIPDKPIVRDLQTPGVNGIFTCSICGKDFNSKLSLKQHVDGKHRAEGKYLCPTCGKRYRWGASFYYHKKTCFPPDSTGTITSQSPELLTTRT